VALDAGTGVAGQHYAQAGERRHHEQFVDERARDGHARGWVAMLDNIEQLFA